MLSGKEQTQAKTQEDFAVERLLTILSSPANDVHYFLTITPRNNRNNVNIYKVNFIHSRMSISPTKSPLF